MESLLTDFKIEFRNRMLELLWRQWTTLGVSGQGSAWSGAMLDPDALVLFSCTLARHDARLFDAILEWMQINGDHLNVQRIKRMLSEEKFSGSAAYRAMAMVSTTSHNSAKWASSTRRAVSLPSTKAEPLFFMKNGQPLLVVGEPDPQFLAQGFLRDRFAPRGVALPFRPEPVANLLLRLRAFLGLTARCEILTYLLLNGRGSPRAISRDCYYYAATVSKSLDDMNGSGFVISRIEGRHRYYTLIPDAWRELMLGKESSRWIVWARLFGALDQLWVFLDRPDLDSKSPLAQASALRRILHDGVADKLDRSGLASVFGDDSSHTGESLIPFVIQRLRTIFDELERF